MTFKPIDYDPSPHYEERAVGSRIEFVIIHYTACDCATALFLFSGGNPLHRVSAHYLIDENGDIYSLVEEKYRAWHAGKSFWKGISDINSHSLGIELVNSGQGEFYRAFPEAQMQSLESLLKDIQTRHNIPPSQFLGHSDVAPGRKFDPGPLFDWSRLAKKGIGLYPPKNILLSPDSWGIENVQEIQMLLAKYGYDVPCSGLLDPPTEAVISAFKMHFLNLESEDQISSLLVPSLKWLIAHS